MSPEIADRLAKLLRLACSNGPDGEKLAAIGRVSAITVANDLDWDRVLLNGNAGPALTQDEMQKIYNAGYERGIKDGMASTPSSTNDWATAGRSRANEVGNKLTDVEKILKAAAAAEAAGVLSDFHIEFCDSMRGRIRDWDTRTLISEKQWSVLQRLRSILERTEYL